MSDSATVSQPFNPKLVAGLIAAGILAFAAFVLLSAYADDFRSGRDGRAHAQSVSAVGFKGIVSLVDLVGGHARLLRSETGPDTEDLVVLTLEPGANQKSLMQLLDRRGSRATLIVLPKWITAPDPQHRGWVMLGPPAAGSTVSDALPDVRIRTEEIGKGRSGFGHKLLEGLTVPAPARAQTLTGEGLVPLIEIAGHGTMLAQVGERPLYILADPDLMNNQGLKDRRVAGAALKILAALNATGAESVTFDLTLNGFGKKPSILKLPFEPPFLAMTLALLVAALLGGMHGAYRFGPPAHEIRAIAFGKMALVENSAGLIQLARREHRTGGAYAELIRDLAAQAAGAPGNLRGTELDSYLDRLSPADSPKFSALAERLQRAGDRFELVSAAHALFLWKKEFIR